MASYLMARRALTPTTNVVRLSTRTFSRRTALRSDKPPFAFRQGPAPPRLPKEEQEIFEELQRKSTGAFSTPQVNQSPDSEPSNESPEFQATGEGEELHPDLRSGVKPEFEGEKNPKTGEVGGPKNEPLRWGAGGDWSYGGRVTDF
ncbi:putative mitochondrial protein, conserved [Aspergillus nanangensis]|uniref:Succinate dehydrogenase assembly factor 4, mitochondrial n=1 Tax=Aspergillus nanangensis TaxID=2582783 RepID=A0AAD4GYA5_ASPNN|nr:putative mitochondrial protein, conserved [Aspergillus nanangensis]